MSTPLGLDAMPAPALPRRTPYRTTLGSVLIFLLVTLYVGGLTAVNLNTPSVVSLK